MDTYNLFHGETIVNESYPTGYRAGTARLAPKLGGSRVGMSVYDLPPGEAVCPYHFHWGDEEWLFVLTGTPTVRTPGGEQTLEPGDVVCFPVGPDGAHSVRNAGGEPVRVAMVANKHEFGIIEYPDSDKMGVWGRQNEALDHLVGRSPEVDYWEGEG
jgi:uncharacterized cupin superfamily protein